MPVPKSGGVATMSVKTPSMYSLLLFIVKIFQLDVASLAEKVLGFYTEDRMMSIVVPLVQPPVQVYSISIHTSLLFLYTVGQLTLF